jgi:hypothetical protein
MASEMGLLLALRSSGGCSPHQPVLAPKRTSERSADFLLTPQIPPERRTLIETMVQKEGDGWLVPRFAQPPWIKFVPEAWHITDQSDLAWVLPRLRPVPVGHFKEPVRLKTAAAEELPRTYIRCPLWHNPSFDRYAEVARHNAGWRHRELRTNHLPFVTHPSELVSLLLEAAN